MLKHFNSKSCYLPNIAADTSSAQIDDMKRPNMTPATPCKNVNANTQIIGPSDLTLNNTNVVINISIS